MSHTLMLPFLRRCAAVLLLGLSVTMAWALPPQIEADRQLKAAGAEMKQDTIDWQRALTALNAAEATGVKMPESFDYYIGRALSETGDPASAVQRFTRYLERYGKRGKFYDLTLEQLNLAERRQAQKLEAEQRARKAEEERVAAEAAAKRLQAEIDSAWEVRYFYYWIMDNEGSGYCSTVSSSIHRGVNSKAVRKIDCDCRTEDVNHPAYRGRTNDVCRGSFEINKKLDSSADLSEQGRSGKWSIKFQSSPFNY
ncbi:hypothetical protein [Hydrogenophaga sp.]|uniref:hypothetical protein n=1 Tax=Hydrogenophaga sp. TaxID=1904254 RepID=UPI002608A9B2|nr:hypothetical protein [Hydrogenophaga sp.]MCW5654909.1 hypothetical protein [Hydrogenophaga sp.]